MKLNWNFQRDREVLKNLFSMGEVWIFSGTTHFVFSTGRGELWFPYKRR